MVCVSFAAALGEGCLAEQYEVAAWRHHRVGELLVAAGELDDAGYHFGVCGETAVKHLLLASGVEAAWIAIGAATGKTVTEALNKTPMRKHFPTLKKLVVNVQGEIAMYARGRYSPTITSLVLDPEFSKRFSGWDINIRYADQNSTPVSKAKCAEWQRDADDFVLALVV